MRIGLRHSTDGRFFAVLSKPVLIGARPGCDITLDDEGVGTEHALIQVTGLGIELEDLGSPAGTYVNGYRIKRHLIARDDQVRMGKTAFVFELSTEAEVAANRCGKCGAEVTNATEALCSRCTMRRAQRPGSSRFTPLTPDPLTSSAIEPVADRVSRATGRFQAVKSDEAESQARLSESPGANWTPPPGGTPTTPRERSLTPPPREGRSGVTPVPKESQLLDGYELVGRLGEGSQGEVYKLRQPKTGKLVAAKRLTARSPTAARRFEREVAALRRLEHPSIVSLIEFRETPTGSFLVMEYVDGPSLAAMMEKEKKIEPKLTLRLAAQIAAGLAHVSRSGIVHRDVKPSNIIVGRNNVAKLTDFGLVLLSDSEVKLTREGQWIGTPRYMAPEQFNGDTPDGRTDVWGLGATFFHAITGELAFDGATATELARKVLNEPVAFEKLKALTGEATVRVFQKLLTKDYRERPSPREAVGLLVSVAQGN
jgi:serine/threonine-protein kinase